MGRNRNMKKMIALLMALLMALTAAAAFAETAPDRLARIREINRFICVLLIYSFEILVAKVRLFRSGQVL